MGAAIISPCFTALLLLTLALTVGAKHGQETTASRGDGALPVVINVWPFIDANSAAWDVLTSGGSPVDAVVEGCSACERDQCDGSVGYGGSPGEDGETSLDAAVMDGDSMDVGAVGGLLRVKHAARAARLVLQHTRHSLLVGDRATQFALEMGLPGPEDLSTPDSTATWQRWRDSACQPNYRVSVSPESSCGPYSPVPPLPPVPQGSTSSSSYPLATTREQELARREASPVAAGARDRINLQQQRRSFPDPVGAREEEGSRQLLSHDTITMVAIAANGSMAAGSSTNGLTYHVPGRVGDAPVAGAGIYAESGVGGCGATGDGDIMMRFLPCFHAVELMRGGTTPTDAAQAAIARIGRKHPLFQGALFAVNSTGHHGGAVNNWVLQYTVRSAGMGQPVVYSVKPVQEEKGAATL